MASLAAFITQAITKVSTDETYANMDLATAEEARDNFTAALLFELGLGPKPVAAHAPVTETKEEKPKKKRAAPKKAQEVAVAEAAVAILEQVKEAPKEVEALTEAMKTLTVEEPKAKKARKTKAAEPEPHFGAGAGVPAPEAAKKKPGPKPKAKTEGASNLEKLTPTHKKHLKAIAEEMRVDPREKEFLAHANAMTAEEWGAKSLDDHIRLFLAPEPPALGAPPKEFLTVEFDGKDYLVDPTNKFIYEYTEGPVRKHVGIVGEPNTKFAEMDLSTDNSTE
jgi:hypothetical protein